LARALATSICFMHSTTMADSEGESSASEEFLAGLAKDLAADKSPKPVDGVLARELAAERVPKPDDESGMAGQLEAEEVPKPGDGAASSSDDECVDPFALTPGLPVNASLVLGTGSVYAGRASSLGAGSVTAAPGENRVVSNILDDETKRRLAELEEAEKLSHRNGEERPFKKQRRDADVAAASTLPASLPIPPQECVGAIVER